MARNWTMAERQRLAKGEIKGEFAGPGMAFPIAGPDDVRDAWNLAGQADNPDAVRRKAIDREDEDYILTMPGGPVKALDEVGNRFGEYLVLWGSETEKDVTGEFFTPETEELTTIFDAMGGIPVIFHHADDDKIKSTVVGVIDVMRPDDVGLWVEARFVESEKSSEALFARAVEKRGWEPEVMQWMREQAQKADQYREAVRELIREGKLHWSSGTLPRARRVAKNGAILRWPIVEASLTYWPADWRMTVNTPVGFIKSAYGAMGLGMPILVNGRGAEDARQGQGGDGQGQTPAKARGSQQLFKGSENMDLRQQLAQALAEARKALEAGDLEKGREWRAKAESIKEALDELEALDALRPKQEEPMRPPVPSSGKGAFVNTGNGADGDQGEGDAIKAFDAIYVMRYGDEKEAVKSVLREVAGRDYRQKIHEQYLAFTKYLRWGQDALSRDEFKALKTQIFAPSDIEHMLREGVTVDAIKATMVEAQGTLGGFAVPPNVQQQIITRLPGLTAVRQGGAQVIELTTSNSVQAPKYTGGDKRYVGALRGQWGSETQNPNEQNATLGFVDIAAHVYTYKVPMSQSLVEDAANLVALVTNDIVNTLAIDEDEAFLIGDGVGKPQGILPGGANTHNLTEVNSGSASALTANGIKKLKRGVATQYRRNAVWVGNSDTFSDIEVMTVTTGSDNYAFPDLSETDRLLNRQVFESEAMPDVAANAYPLIFGDMSGYWIVQKAGLTIVRFQDSNTGINKVEYHVRRRVGGRLVKPWCFAVQKVAA